MSKQIRITRRTMLKAMGAGAVLLATRRHAWPHNPHMPDPGPGTLEPSPMLMPFQDALRIPPVLKPVVVGKTHYYTLSMRPGMAQTHRSLPATPIWGFNGLFPGPTIRAVRGHPVIVRQWNQLPTGGDAHHPLPAVHLHGAHVAPEHDGHPRESIPHGASREYIYPNQQRGSTLFYHDHAHGATGEHVYKGLAGLYIIDDPAEPGAAALPAGEFDVPLIVQDRIFRSDGSFNYVLNDETREMGMHGDTILVNGVVQPYFRVAARKYRFRLLNASNARIYDFQLSSGKPFLQIASDGGLLPSPQWKSVIPLAPSERAEVVIDFAEYSIGSSIILKNCACDDRTSDIMRFNVVRAEEDDSVIPDCLGDWKELPVTTADPPREFTLTRPRINNQLTWTINGKPYSMTDPPAAQIKLGSVERWRFVNPTNHPHPMHLHLVQFQVLDINGQLQDPSRHGWKDTLVVPANGEATIIARFGEYTGRYLFHCHNLEHEDFAMMAEFEVVPA